MAWSSIADKVTSWTPDTDETTTYSRLGGSLEHLLIDRSPCNLLIDSGGGRILIDLNLGPNADWAYISDESSTWSPISDQGTSWI